jgi:hypothetical protein
MSVSSVTNAFASYAQKLTGSASAPSSGSSALEEATETKAETTKEAQKGDRVAKALLQREQQQQQLEAPTTAAEPGKGEQVDKKG